MSEYNNSSGFHLADNTLLGGIEWKPSRSSFVILPLKPLNQIRICLEDVGKASNSGLLTKGAADWLAAGAHLKSFPLKQFLKVHSPQTLQCLGGGVAKRCQRRRWALKWSLETLFEQF
jgi:hypothetical protein